MKIAQMDPNGRFMARVSHINGPFSGEPCHRLVRFANWGAFPKFFQPSSNPEATSRRARRARRGKIMGKFTKKITILSGIRSQFANWKITIFEFGKSTIKGPFSLCNKLPEGNYPNAQSIKYDNQV